MLNPKKFFTAVFQILPIPSLFKAWFECLVFCKAAICCCCWCRLAAIDGTRPLINDDVIPFPSEADSLPLPLPAKCNRLSLWCDEPGNENVFFKCQNFWGPPLMTSDTKGKEAGLLVRTKCMVKCVTQMVRFFWSFRGFVEGSKRRTVRIWILDVSVQWFNYQTPFENPTICPVG